MANSTYTTPVERLEAASAAWLRDLEEQGRLSRTVEAYASTLADFTSFFGADEDKSDIPSYAEVLLWRGNLESRGCRERTVAQYLRQLRAFFDWACEHGWYQANPVLKRLIPTVSDLPPVEYVTLHDWQLRRLYTYEHPQNAKAATYPRNYAIAILLLTTDLCNGELLHLTPADLHWADNVIAARDGHTGEVRQVAFSGLAQSAVQLYLASGIRPKNVPDTAPLFGNTAPKGSFGPRTGDESREWQQVALHIGGASRQRRGLRSWCALRGAASCCGSGRVGGLVGGPHSSGTAKCPSAGEDEKPPLTAGVKGG